MNDYIEANQSTSFNKFIDMCSSYYNDTGKPPFSLENGTVPTFEEDFKSELLKYFNEDYITLIVQKNLLKDAKNSIKSKV